MNRHFVRRWVALVVLAGAPLQLTQAAEATAAPEPAPEFAVAPGPTAAAAESASTAGLALTAAGKRGRWQERLTLGPGDILNLALFDSPESVRTDLPIGPDGLISFLQAQDIMAAGLTVDELRARLDDALAKFYQNPRTIVTPVSYRSKKYMVLGAVVARGAYVFDRPMTIIEAIARAGGLETGVYQRKTVEMADLSRSFLVRKGERLQVDFERLFQRGDLSQNVALEPDDYLYFASSTGNDIYVLGEVGVPGVLSYATRPTLISAITSRGGFGPHAFRTRVLVVRGSLNHPETFVVDAVDILHGKIQDFKLQPRDIVYVSNSPWKIAIEVVDMAARSFVQAFFIQNTTLHMPALINN